MSRRLLTLSYFVVLGVVFVPLSQGGIVFKPGEKARYVAPGEEEISGNAQHLFQVGQEAEQKNNWGRAIYAYRNLVRKYPNDALAPGAAYRCAELQEQTHDLVTAANSYRFVVEHYPQTPHFNDAIEGQFRIGEVYLNGKKIKWMGLTVANALDRAVEIFAAIIRTAPYGKYTARAQFDIGRAREKQGANDAALQAYQAVVDKFPNSEVAPDAQYQIGYIWFRAAKEGTKDAAATSNARTAFQDFLYRFPNSEKAAQVRSNLSMLDQKQTNNSFDIAKFYDKQKYYRAAVIYYNEVIRQQPGSPESAEAQKRIDQLKSKVGADALKPGFAAAEAEAAKKKAEGKQAARNGGPAVQGSANDSAPLPAADQDTSLPPPASTAPENTTAPTQDLGSPEYGTEPSSTPAP